MRVVASLVLLLAAGSAWAQPASLVADRVRIEADRTLVAEGNVEVFYEGARLNASRISFDGKTEALTIEGPIRITEGDGDAILLGTTAELEPGLRDGILQGARLVLDQQVQIAADELAAIGGRYRRLTNAVASSCRVCADRPTPLWEIRAARVLHDTEERQIYFTGAQFRVVGLPVFYVPRLRLPDPTVERARGFLAPQIKGSGDVGQGPVLPYFVPLGPSADITLAPFLTPKTRTLEYRYRQLFVRGGLNFNGAVSRDDIRPGETRGYIFGYGDYILPRGFLLRFGIQETSDDDYLDSYGYFEGARLQNNLMLDRVRGNEMISAAIFYYDILRPGDLNAADQNLVLLGEAEYTRAIPSRFGNFFLTFDGNVFGRDSEQEVLGRDVGRIGTALGWSNGGVLPLGISLVTEAELRGDAYTVRRAPAYAPHEMRLTPIAAATLRWPFVKHVGSVSETLEPVAQLAWADVFGGDVPDEDSRVPELDEGNLIGLDRFPGKDRSETGTRLNLGMSYNRLSPDWQFDVYVGRIYRFDDRFQFSEPTGLNGKWSDWLVSGQLGLGEDFTVTNRAVFDEELEFARNELRLALEAGSAEFATSYLWLEENPAEDLSENVHEAILTAGYEFGRHWIGAIETRWDFIEERVARTDFDLTYRNECIALDLYLSRRYEEANDLDPTYDFGIELSLQGFGSGDSARYARRCTG
jgi:LPS-assembly protein